MNKACLRDRVRRDITQIPDGDLSEVYGIMYHYREARQKRSQPETLAGFAGVWKDMPSAAFEGLFNELKKRRQAAGSRRCGG